MLLLVIGLVWSSVLSLTGEAELTLEEALDMAAPRAEEEQSAPCCARSRSRLRAQRRQDQRPRLRRAHGALPAGRAS
jgi:hypothetical protein